MDPENQPYIISHAQNREDIILSGFFSNQKSGYYIDIGANDPSADSVTKYFYDKGWKGINIEPIKSLYEKLKEARPRDTNLNFGISNKSGRAKFREYKTYHGLSTFDSVMQEDYDDNQEDKNLRDFIEYEVEVKTLKQVLDEQKVATTINFLKVDVEGYEYEVLEGNDWSKYRPQVICIESNHISKDWRPQLLENGYQYCFNDGLNDYYVAKEAKDLKNSFSYVQTMLPTPIIDYRVVGIMEFYKKARLQADARNVDLNNEIHNLRHQLYVKQEALQELTRVRGLVKSLAKKLNNIIEETILPHHYTTDNMPAPDTRVDIKIVASSNPTDIMKSIKEYDQTNLTSLNPPKHRIRYLLFGFYRKAIKGLYFTAKAMLRVLNRMKRRLRR